MTLMLKKADGTTDFADDADKKELPSERVFTSGWHMLSVGFTSVAEPDTARLTRGLARQGERQKPSVSTLGTSAPAVESRQGRQKHMIAARFFRPFGTWLAFGLESQR